MNAALSQDLVLPDDAHNQALVANAHPPDWQNPDPGNARYNLVVVGGGTAGLVSAIGAAGLGARVAIVERHLYGGDCLNYGCVPSKGVIRASRAIHDVRSAGAFGVRVAGVQADFGAAMERMRRLRAGISRNDSAHRMKDLGIDVYVGAGRFVGPDRLEVDGKTLRFRRAVIATGARSASLPVPGLAEIGAHTNETIFSLTELPRRLVVIGAGPIGCELAQAFRRFGSEVTIVSLDARVLPREDPDASAIVGAQLEAEGIGLKLGARLVGARRTGSAKEVVFDRGQGEEVAVGDEILVAVGRAPNTEGLGLEKAGVVYDKMGVKVDERLRTSNPRIYAAGDIATAYKFTHAADAMARVVLQNALFFGWKRASALTIPWCTFTDPEVAHVGMYEEDAKKRGIDVDTLTVELKEVDRAVLDGEDEGFARIHVDRRSGRILGATLVARHAGEMIGEAVLAVSEGLGTSALVRATAPYPTQGEVWRRLGDMHQRARLTPTVRSWLARWFAWWR